MSSGAPFNPMRKTPPPPPYLDTIGLDPLEYISVEPGDGPLFLVSRDCLRVSPLIRRAFEKRVNITLPEIEVTFICPDEDEEEEELDVQSQQSDPMEGAEEEPELEEEPLAAQEQAAAGGEESAAAAEEDDENAGDTKKKKQETIFPEDPLYAIPKVVRPPVVYAETLLNDKTVLVRFPQLKSPTLEVVIAYLYYKHRYEGKPHEPREPFTLPINVALEIMKLASILEC